MDKYVFKMEIGLDEEYMQKLFKLHEKFGGSNVSISEVIEECLRRGIDEGFKN